MIGLVREGFLRGVSTRQVGEVLAPMLSEAYSTQTVSRVSRGLDAAVAEFRWKSLTLPFNIRLDNSRFNAYHMFMMDTIQVVRPGRLANCPEETAFLELLRTTDMLSRGLVNVLKTKNLSPTQYNVLGILRGSPEGLPCGEIASRMITRDPDVTRLLDRLEKRGVISRCRETKDRRMVMARITPQGLQLLGRLDEPVQAAHRRQLGHLGRAQLRALTGLLRVARAA